jgi:2-methylcitrate dehydratase
MLLHGDVWTDSYSVERLRDPALLSLMSRTKVEERAHLTAAYPAELLTEYEILLKNGKAIRERTTYPKGHPRNPMTSEDVARKFVRLTQPLLDRDRIDAIQTSILNLENLKVADLVGQLVFQR